MVAMKRILASLAACVCAFTASAQANDITGLRFGEHETYTRIVIESEAPLEARAFTLEEPVSRLVVSFGTANWAVPHLPQGNGQGRGLVGAFQFRDDSSAPRLIFSLDGPVTIQQELSLDPNEGGGHRTVLDVARTSATTFAQLSGFPAQTADLGQFLAQQTNLPIAPVCALTRVVIDPGHGGRDPGALARFGGGDEADVNLAAGLVLRDLLNATGRYEVIMTRDRDVAVELMERVEIAQHARADLFISLHADSAGESTRPQGATVYSMNHRALTRARNRAINEGDWVDANRPEEVSRILVEMSLTNKENQSEAFASSLRTEVSRVRPLWRDEAMRANFAVLTDASVPAVLFEMGFLTNREDARRLNNASERRRLMQAVSAAIDNHFANCGGGAPNERIVASNGSDRASTR